MRTFLFFLVISHFCLNVSAQDWNQMGDDIPGVGLDDRSGASVSLSNDGLTMAIGSPFNADIGPNVGHVRIFTYDGSSWLLKGNPIEGNATEFGFGISVSLSSDASRVAVCASYGKTRVYDWNGSLWQQIGNDIVTEPHTMTTGSVALSGNGEVVGIGDLGNTTAGSSSGQVRLYTLNGDIWQQKGSLINGSINGLTGSALSISEDGNTFATNLKKDIQVYSWIDTDWGLKGTEINEFPAEKVSLSADGNTMAISGYNAIGQTDNKGMAQVYQWNGTSWNPKGNTVQGDMAQSYFGWSVCLSKNGKVMAVGTPQGDLLIGEIKVFVQAGSNWEQVGNTLFGERSNDRLGHSISLNGTGNILGVGLPNFLHYNNAGLMDKSKVFHNDEISGMTEINPMEITIYPNPSNGDFTIDLGKEYKNVSIEISNTLGQLISSEKYTSVKTIDSMVKGSAGIYFINIKTAERSFNSFKIIKN